MVTGQTRAERKRQELREEITDAAFEVFSERGYHDAGIAEIARRVGIGHGTFYRYFKNKREILDQVIDDVLARILAILAAENAPQATTSLAEYRAQTERIGDALLAVLADDPRAVRLLVLQAGTVDAELEARLMQLAEAATGLTAAYLVNGRERGFLHPELDVEATAQAIIGLILGGTLTALRVADVAAQQRYKRAAIALMFGGIAAAATS